MYLSRARCHCPVKAWNMSIYLTFTIHVHVVKLGGNPLALMPGRISAFKLLGIDGIDARSKWSN